VNVRVHIERLILEGIDLDPAGRPLLQTALEAELVRLLAEGGVRPELRVGGAVPAVQAAGFELSGAAEPASLGRQIARSVYGGVGT
jgi:hypothetical protein